MLTLADILDIEDKLAIRRSVVLFVTLWMTWRAFEWAAVFAAAHPSDGLVDAAIIGAVTAPITYLQASVFKAYLDSK